MSDMWALKVCVYLGSWGRDGSAFTFAGSQKQPLLRPRENYRVKVMSMGFFMDVSCRGGGGARRLGAVRAVLLQS